MCCSLQNHTQVIAIICIIFTVIGAAISYATTEIDQLYQGNTVVAIAVQVSIYVVQLLAYIFCLIGAIKGNKCMLIPFIIVTSLEIILWIGLGILVIILFASSVVDVLFILLAIIFLSITLGFSIYFLVIVAKYYNELDMGIASGEQPDYTRYYTRATIPKHSNKQEA